MTHFIRRACLITALLLVPLAPATAARIEVDTTPQQTFESFGHSMSPFANSGKNKYVNFSDQDLDMLYTDLRVNLIKVWAACGPGCSDYPNAGEVQKIKSEYIDNGVWEDAKRHGVRKVLLGPEAYKGDPVKYAKDLAKFVQDIEGIGLPVYATGVMNEPSCGRRHALPPDEGAELMINLRKELNALGLQRVKILSPEFCQTNHLAERWVDGVGQNAEANASYDAVGTHSYGQPATAKMRELVLKYDKLWWQTEGGDPGIWFGHKMLNDINHGVSVWFGFLGCCGGDEHYLMNGPSRPNHTYHYMKLTSDMIVPGTVIRHVTIDGKETMAHREGGGTRTPFTAAVGVRPDGRWTINVFNGSGGNSVDITVPELADVPSLEFDVCRAGGSGITCEGTVTLNAGKGSIPTPRGQETSLLAQTPTEPTGQGGSGSAGGGTTGAVGPAQGCDRIVHPTLPPHIAFGAPYNVFSDAHELLISVACTQTGATVTVGAGNQLHYIYRLAYLWQGGQWTTVPLSGTVQPLGGAWYPGQASGQLPVTAAQLGEDNFVVGFVCQWRGQGWSCGCRDQACSVPQWQLQVFRQ